MTQVGANWVELELADAATLLHNGDGLCYYDLQKELTGLAINRAERMPGKANRWRVFPKDALAALPDLRRGTEVNRNRDMDWVRALEKKSAVRRIGLWAALHLDADTLTLTLNRRRRLQRERRVRFRRRPAAHSG